MDDGLVSSGMLLDDRNRCMCLIWIQIWLWHCYKLSVRLIRCDLVQVIHKWLHRFALDIFLRAIHVSLENSICWRLGIPILVNRFSDPNMSHLPSNGAHVASNLIVVNVGLPLVSICNLNKLVLAGWVDISKWTNLVLNVISKLRSLLCTMVTIHDRLARLCRTRHHIALLILLVIIYNLIMHSLIISRHHYNSSLWYLLIYLRILSNL